MIRILKMEVSCQTRRIFGFVQVQDVVCKPNRDPTVTQYIHSFIRKIKEILRPLDNLNGVRVHISGLDRNNTIHEWIVSVLDIIKDMINLPLLLERSVFICIQKRSRIIFLGHIQF
jgi:hypothetical protein